MSLRRRARRSILLATVLALVISLVPLFVAPAAAANCSSTGDVDNWAVSFQLSGGPINAYHDPGSSVGAIDLCTNNAAFDSMDLDTRDGGGLDNPGEVRIRLNVNATLWKLSGAKTGKITATLQYASEDTEARVYMPNGQTGYLQQGTTITINTDYGSTAYIWIDGKVCRSICYTIKGKLVDND